MEFYLIDDFSTLTHTHKTRSEKNQKLNIFVKSVLLYFLLTSEEASSVHTQKTEKKKIVYWLHKTIFMDKKDTLSFFLPFFQLFYESFKQFLVIKKRFNLHIQLFFYLVCVGENPSHMLVLKCSKINSCIINKKRKKMLNCAKKMCKRKNRIFWLIHFFYYYYYFIFVCIINYSNILLKNFCSISPPLYVENTK